MKKKRVNVFVCIQMDIPNVGDRSSEVHRVLDLINDNLDGVDISLSNANVEIITQGLDESNIIDTDDFDIGCSVIVPDPNDTDIHNHSFVGMIKDFRGDNAVIEDMDGYCFEIETNRLTLI